MNVFDLLQLPLSAYTPGMGDRSMEGGYETASGAPVYTYEQWLAGKAPYVTGATSMKNPSGSMVYRNIGGQQVPVRITDYGPGVKGIDIASSNPKWATNFPYQGQTDKFMLAQDDRGALLNDINNSIYGGGQAPAPTPTPAPAAPWYQRWFGGSNPAPTPTPTPGPQNMAANVPAPAGINDLVPPPSFNFDRFNNMVSAQNAAGSLGGALGSELAGIGRGMQQQGQQGMQQALAMLQRDPRAAAALAQLANNPWTYLTPIS